MLKEGWGRRLKEARELRGLSQEQVAEAAGVSKSAVSFWEKETTTPSVPNLVAANQLLRVRLDWLFYGIADFSADTIDYAERYEQATPEERERMRAAVVAHLGVQRKESPFRRAERESSTSRKSRASS